MASILPVASRNAFKRSVVRIGVPTTSVAPRRYSSTMHDNDPDVLEVEKMRNLSKQQHHTSTPLPEAPGWNEALASASEAAVKADHYTGSAKEMQEHTVKYLKGRHHAKETPNLTDSTPFEPGVSTSHMRNNGNGESEATYSRDEVDGPLKHAHAATVEKVEHKENITTRKSVA